MRYIKLRIANGDDIKRLFVWKNDSTVRKYSIVTHNKIKYKDHVRWFNKNYYNIFIIEYNNTPCGDIRVEDGYIAIKLDKKYRGIGIATEALSCLPLKDKYAKIVDGNIPSMRLFIKLGFIPIGHKKNYYILKYEGCSCGLRRK